MEAQPPPKLRLPHAKVGLRNAWQSNHIGISHRVVGKEP